MPLGFQLHNKKIVFFLKPGSGNHLVGLVVKVSASRAANPGFKPRLCWDFSGLSHLESGTPVATLLGAWHYRVRDGTGRPDVNIL